MRSHINLCNQHLVDLGNQGKRYNFIDTIFQQLRTHDGYIKKKHKMIATYNQNLDVMSDKQWISMI